MPRRRCSSGTRAPWTKRTCRSSRTSRPSGTSRWAPTCSTSTAASRAPRSRTSSSTIRPRTPRPSSCSLAASARTPSPWTTSRRSARCRPLGSPSALSTTRSPANELEARTAWRSRSASSGAARRFVWRQPTRSFAPICSRTRGDLLSHARRFALARAAICSRTRGRRRCSWRAPPGTRWPSHERAVGPHGDTDPLRQGSAGRSYGFHLRVRSAPRCELTLAHSVPCYRRLFHLLPEPTSRFHKQLSSRIRPREEDTQAASSRTATADRRACNVLVISLAGAEANADLGEQRNKPHAASTFWTPPSLDARNLVAALDDSWNDLRAYLNQHASSVETSSHVQGSSPC
mmetsp:Transcript_32176/g.70504  ORF Transcript_32176/g.70504 Transcript_32176/m.70504 type:complete len:346 (-) Transcript_32176:193-1230(-)